MNYYILRLTGNELVELINSIIQSANARGWDGKLPAIEGSINHVVVEELENGKVLIRAKRVIGQGPYAVFDIGAFEADDYTMNLLLFGKKYLSFDTELHEYMAVRFGSNYIDDYYDFEQQRITKENIRLTLLSGKPRGK